MSNDTKNTTDDTSILYRLAFRMGMHQKKKLSRAAFFRRTLITAVILFSLFTILFVWLPRAAYVGTAEIAVIFVAILLVFGRIILSLFLGFMGYEKARKTLKK